MRSSTKAIGTFANGIQWLRVVDDRVECARIGRTQLDRCRECAYLVRLDSARGGRTTTHVLCLSSDLPDEPGFAW
jgi:hypothetical protein